MNAGTKRSDSVRVLPNVEVLHIDILVGSGFPLAPQEETLLRRGFCNEEEKQREEAGVERSSRRRDRRRSALVCAHNVGKSPHYI